MSYLDTYCAKVRDFEGRCPFLYLDSVGLKTCGEGIMIPNLAASLQIAWCNPDWSAADEAAISADWNRVGALPVGRISSAYNTDDALQLEQSTIDSMTLAAVTNAVRGILKGFPDYLSYPEGPQMAILDLCYGLGVTKFLNTYPTCCAAIRSQDWATAAKASGRNVSNPAFANRNLWCKQQFLTGVPQ